MYNKFMFKTVNTTVTPIMIWASSFNIMAKLATTVK